MQGESPGEDTEFLPWGRVEMGELERRCEFPSTAYVAGGECDQEEFSRRKQQEMHRRASGKSEGGQSVWLSPSGEVGFYKRPVGRGDCPLGRLSQL